MTFVIVPLLGWADRPARALVVDEDAGSAYVVLGPEEPAVPLHLNDRPAPSAQTSIVDRAVTVACANTTELRAASEGRATAATFVEALQLADVLLAADDGTVPRSDLDPHEMKLLIDLQREVRNVSDRLSALGRVRLEEVLGAVAEVESQLERVVGQARELGRRPLRPRNGHPSAPSIDATALTPIHLLDLPSSAVVGLHARDIYTVGELLEQSEEIVDLGAESRRRVRIAAEVAGLELPGWLQEPGRPVSATRSKSARSRSERAGGDVSGDSRMALTQVPGMPSGAVRALEAAGNSTLGQLTTLTPKELRKIPGIGPKRAADIVKVLEERGLKLATETSSRSVGQAPNVTTPTAPKAGVGVVTKIHADGYGFLQSDTGEDLYMSPGEMRSIVRDLAVGDSVAYRKIKPGTRRREAVGLRRAVPNVVGLTRREARDLLERQRLRVEEETGGRRIWIESNWRVTVQHPRRGSAVPRDAIITIHLTTGG